MEAVHPFYRPLWRRIAIVAAIAGWLAFEVFHTRDTFWITVAAAALAYGLWTFFLNWPREPGSPEK